MSFIGTFRTCLPSSYLLKASNLVMAEAARLSDQVVAARSLRLFKRTGA